MLKSIATGSNKPSQAQKQTSPYARKLEGVVALEVDKFEEINGQIFAIGTNIETGEVMKITREWSTHPRNQGRPNPMKAASERLEAGAVMMFTGVDPFATGSLKDAYHAAGFETVTLSADPDALVRLESKKSVFVDQIDSGSDGDQFQLYNVVEGDESIRVENPEDLVRAFADHISEANLENDAILLRIYSPEEGIASVIRFFLSPDESLEEALNRFTESEAHYIEMVGAQEGVMEVSGPALMSMLADNDMDAIWEVIPVRGYRHGISHPKEEIASSLKKKAQEVFADGVVDANGALHGFRQATFAYQQKRYANGKTYSSVRAFHHEPGMAQALALVPTGHVDDLVQKFGQGPLQSEATASEKVDVSDLIKQLAAEVEAKRATVQVVEEQEAAVSDLVDDATDFMADEEVAEVEEVEDVDFMSESSFEDAEETAEIEVEDFLADDYSADAEPELEDDSLAAAEAPAEEVVSEPEPVAVAVEVEEKASEDLDWDFPENDILATGGDDVAVEEAFENSAEPVAETAEPVAEEIVPTELEEVLGDDNSSDVDAWFDEGDTVDLDAFDQEEGSPEPEVEAASVDDVPADEDILAAFDDAVYDMDSFETFDDEANVAEAEVAAAPVVAEQAPARRAEMPDYTSARPAPREVEEKPDRVRLNEREAAAQPATIDRPMPMKGTSRGPKGSDTAPKSDAPKADGNANKGFSGIKDFRPDPADEVSLASGIVGARDYSIQEIMKTAQPKQNLASSEPHVKDTDPLSDEALASAFGIQ